MRSNLLTIASAIALLFCVPTPAFAQGVPIGVRGSVPICTHAQLHAGTCQLAQPGYTATITNGTASESNACASGAPTGSDQITCRYKTGTGWEEFEPGGGGSDDQTATEVPFTSTIAAFVSANVRVALDYLYELFSRTDADGDGLYEFAYIKDFDGDGSGYVVCTGNATPDIQCKATGEVVYRDFFDDANCGWIGCGFGKMERDGVLKLRNAVVYVGFACWDASNPAENSAEASETNDDLHDSLGDTTALANCPRDPDNQFLTALSFQGWQGTLEGSGTDSRNLHRGNMNALTKRDRGTYIVNDMGPWHQGPADNFWFGNAEHQRGISAGYHSLHATANNHTGAASSDGDSKGWGKVILDADFESFGADTQILCLKNTGGVVGVDYSASGWVANLARGDIILVPVRPSSSGVSTYFVHEARVKETPTVACGSGGLRVGMGGSITTNGLAQRTYPAFAGRILAADNQIVGHARSDYAETRVRLTNFTLSPADFWNEAGGRCTSSGGAWPAPPANGTIFTLTADNANTDFSCDTQNLVGFWGGGRIELVDVVMTHGHQYWIDGGSSGGLHTIERVKFLFGNGGPVFDSGNGWRLRDSIIDQSAFNTTAVSVLGPGFVSEDLEIRNSTMTAIVTLNENNEGSHWLRTRIVSTAHNHPFYLACGARRNSIVDTYQTGRGSVDYGGYQAGIALLDCADTANPITGNFFDGSVIDAPDSSIAAETAPAFLFRAAGAGPTSSIADLAEYEAIFGNSFTGTRVQGNGSGAAGEAGSLYGVLDFTDENPADDDGESYVFTLNQFDGGFVPASGRAWSVNRSNGESSAIDSDSLSGTPEWGDPLGCGNRDGLALVPYQRCDASQLGRGTITVDFANMATTGACTSATSRALRGALTTDSVLWGATADLSGVTGWTPSASLILYAYPTANAVNFKACNPTAGALDPASVTLWWKAVR